MSVKFMSQIAASQGVHLYDEWTTEKGGKKYRLTEDGIEWLDGEVWREENAWIVIDLFAGRERLRKIER